MMACVGKKTTDAPTWRAAIVNVAAFVVMGLGIASCDNLFARHFHWFQKLTVTVDTPAGAKSGAAVIDVKAEYYKKGTYIGNAARVDRSGEAGVIEVLPGKFLFILLKGFDQSTAALTFIPRSPPGEKREIAEAKRFAIMETFETAITTTDLSPRLYPVFVTFRDIADPASLIIVNPQNLARDFGPGVTLRSVKLTVSPNETIPNEVRHILPWLEVVRKERGRIVPGRVVYQYQETPVQKIVPSHFLTRDRWRRD
jgi:hypothetical protein